MKKITLVFLIAFALNIVWENIHSLLYSHYMGGEITQFILVRASLFDAFVITVISLPFLYFTFLKNKTWLLIILMLIIAIFNEYYGLHTGRWAYNEFMPIIPIIKTGLTPTIQLGLLGYLTIKLQGKIQLSQRS